MTKDIKIIIFPKVIGSKDNELFQYFFILFLTSEYRRWVCKTTSNGTVLQKCFYKYIKLYSFVLHVTKLEKLIHVNLK